MHAVVARSTFRSQNVQNTTCSDHYWKLRCRKSARRCGAKHMSKSKCTKHTILGPLLEVEMSKKCTPLWREAHFEVKMYKTPHARTTFGSWDVEKAHAVVARSTFRSQNVQNTPFSNHFWKLRCRKSARRCGAHFEVKMYKTPHAGTTFGSWDVEKVHAVVARSTCRSQNVQNTPFLDHYWKLSCRKSARRCGAKHISKSKCTKQHMLGPLLEVETSKKCTPLWREAHFEVKMWKTPGFRPLLDVQMSFRVAVFNYNHHYNTPLQLQLHLDYIPLHYTTLHYTTLHYTPLHSTTLHYIPLHYTTLHYITLHSTTLHYNYTTLTFQYTTLHYTTLHSTTLHYTPLHSDTLHYITLHYTTLHHITLHYATFPRHYAALH